MCPCKNVMFPMAICGRGFLQEASNGFLSAFGILRGQRHQSSVGLEVPPGLPAQHFPPRFASLCRNIQPQAVDHPDGIITYYSSQRPSGLKLTTFAASPNAVLPTSLPVAASITLNSPSSPSKLPVATTSNRPSRLKHIVFTVTPTTVLLTSLPVATSTPARFCPYWRPRASAHQD